MWKKLGLFVFNFGLMLCTQALAVVEIQRVTKEDIDSANRQYLDLYHRIRNYTGTQKNLDDVEGDFVQSTRRYLLTTLLDIEQKKMMPLGPECQFFDFFLEILNPTLLKQEQWTELRSYSPSLRYKCTKANLEKKGERKKEFLESLEGEYAPGIAEFIRFIDESSTVADGDTIVGIGNTPQIMLESLRFSKKNLNLVSVAISKWPGFYKSSAATADRYESKVGAAILTPQALENYRRYLGEVGLRVGAKISEKNRVFFMDNVGEGRGLEFLMVQLLHDFLMHGIKPPDLRVIAFSPMRAKVTQFSGKFLKCEQISFGNDHVDETIIQMDLHEAYSAFRFTPNFPAGLWHDWRVNPHERPYYPRAFEEQKALMKGLETLGLKLNPHNVIMH